MARIQDRKSNFYSHKQFVLDESSAPQYLESAGDVLIKDLAKKQTSTHTTLKEQLEVVQNFERGHCLNPDIQKGITTLEDFKKSTTEEKSKSIDESVKESETLEELQKSTGLSRHELELSLSEKPNSTISKLYKFAIANKKQEVESERIEYRLPGHPIHRLKEIEEECFGHLTNKKKEVSSSDSADNQDVVDKSKEMRVKKKKKHRKRKKKHTESVESNKAKLNKLESTDKLLSSNEVLNKNEDTSPPCRPSLWDVKDMKKWCEPKKYGCNPQTFYTIKEGQIIKLEKKFNSEDVT